MAPVIAELLRNQPWAQDGSEETEQLLRDIVGAQIPRPNVGQERVQDVTQLIEILGEQPWYQDGLDTDEKVILAGLFRTFSSLQLGRVNERTGEPIYPFLNEYHIPSLYASAIEDQRFLVLRLADSHPVTLIALADVGDEAGAAQALHHAKTHLAGVTRLAGMMRSTTVVIVVEPDIGSCGRAYHELFLTRIDSNCVRPEVIVHELTHLATPLVLATWFEEGTAYWVEQHLTGTQSVSPLLDSAQLRRETTFDLSCCDSRSDPYEETLRGGMAFWYDLELIIGAEAVGNAIKGVPEGLAREAIPAIIRVTPPDKQAAVRSLITERCREYRQARMLPCTIPAR